MAEGGNGAEVGVTGELNTGETTGGPTGGNDDAISVDVGAGILKSAVPKGKSTG